MFLGPETSQETLKKPKSRPRSTQRAPKARKKSAKKNPKKCLCGKKCLKVAISFLPFLGPNFGGQICIFLSSFFNILLLTFRRTFGTHFGAHSWTRSAQERPRWTQEDHQELQRVKKQHFQKSGFRVGLSAFFHSWGLPREPQKAQEGSQEAPKELQNPNKKESKIGPKN